MTFMGAMNDVTDDVIEYRVLCELGRWPRSMLALQSLSVFCHAG